MIKYLHEENHSVYGVRKMHALLKRQGWNIGRDQTTRLCVWRGRAVWHGRRWKTVEQIKLATLEYV